MKSTVNVSSASQHGGCSGELPMGSVIVCSEHSGLLSVTRPQASHRVCNATFCCRNLTGCLRTHSGILILRIHEVVPR